MRTASESSAPAGQRDMSVKTTKKGGRKTGASRSTRVAEDEILPEYDFSMARRNHYASRLANGVVTVTLDPDVARVFPDGRSVNDALRALVRIATQRRTNRGPRTSKPRPK